MKAETENLKSTRGLRGRRIFGISGIVGMVPAGVVAYLALRASPWVGELPWVPKWLAEWADRNGNLRNLPAFALLALCLIWPLGIWRGAATAAALAVGLEAAQLFAARRSFDWADIGWSLAGVIAVFAPAAAWNRWRDPKPPCN